jgi:dTDP-glucose pyrophosphorylase
MLNVLIPLGSNSMFFEGNDYPFPKPLVEIQGVPMIQRVIENLKTLHDPKRFIFVLRDEDCTRHHLDSTVRLLAGDDCVILRLHHPTQGAACSALLAIEHIGNTDPLLIVNADQIFSTDLNAQLARFREAGSDAGCLTFQSVHPRWSYVRLDGEHDVIETAEKHPISHHAIAGFYYFARGWDFVLAAQASIRKGASVDDTYYVAPVLNELILQDRRVQAFAVPNEAYHTFYSPKKIEEYELARSR